MLERLSTSADGVRQKATKAMGDRLHVLGHKKQVPFHIVISELRAELMNTKQHVAGAPCVLLWVRGDTVHVTEDSVGQTVLSWSDTYFTQVVQLQASGHGFRPKECKFKVQQKGKTIAKTAVLDLAKYCSDLGLARDQSVSVPLQPGGTLYFVISTAPASEAQVQQQGPTAGSTPQDSAKNFLARDSQDPSVGGGGAAAAATAAASAVTSAAARGTADSGPAEESRHKDGSQYASVAAKYGAAGATAGNAVASSVASAAAATTAGVTPPSSGGKGRAAASPETAAAAAALPTGDALDRPSGSGRGHSKKPSGGATSGWAMGLAAVAANVAARGSPSTPPTHATDGGAVEEDTSTGVFKRKTRGGAAGGGGGGGSGGAKPPTSTPTSAFATAGGAVAAGAAAVASAAAGGTKSAFAKGQKHAPAPGSLRKSGSDHYCPAEGSDMRVSCDTGLERSLSQAMVGTTGRPVRGSGQGGFAGATRAIRSFTGSPPAGRSSEPISTPLQLQLPQSALEGMQNLSRPSASASTCSDTAAMPHARKRGGGGGGGSIDGGPAGGGSAAAGSAGSGWGAWLRGGLGWGRGSNHSATGMSTGPQSTASLVNGGAAAAEQQGGGGGGESSALEAAITGATELAELREIALDLMHERDEWRSRAMTAQDAMGRAHAARGSAVREAQRLEVRLRQYQDELGRRTDGSLLQELVEAKVRIADLANENMKLRRQITHMGPLFYDDSGDEAAPEAGRRT